MGGGGAMDDDYYGYDDNLAEANNAEFGDEGLEIILEPMAEDVVDSAADAEEALAMCRDLATAEDLDEEDYTHLLEMVEARTGWQLPREGGGI